MKKYISMLILAVAAMFAANLGQAAIVDYTYQSGSLSGEGYYSTEVSSGYWEPTAYEYELYYDDETNTAYEYFAATDGTINVYFYGHWNPGVPGAAFIDSTNGWFWNYDFAIIFGSDPFFSLHPIPPPPTP